MSTHSLCLELVFYGFDIYHDIAVDIRTKNRPLPFSLIVLAGGESRRMNTAKALLPVKKTTLLEFVLAQLEDRFAETLISVSDVTPFEFLNRRLVEDDRKGYGPLMGIRSTLAVSSYEKNFVVACDIPTIPLDVFDRILRAAQISDLAVPIHTSGRIEPLFGVYSKSVLPSLDTLIRDDVHSLLPLFELCKTEFITLNESSWPKNLNTQKDYEEFLRGLKKT